MPRRVNLPGASELFRPTAGQDATDASVATQPVPDAEATRSPAGAVTPAGDFRPSGRIKHDEKITVYVSSEELLALEQLRLTLRAQHGVAVDRGRIVRAAIAEALADVHAQGADAALVRRLTA